ncbi:hypothetical protein Tco_1157291 [Tanacetum coccineum]
MDLSKETDDYIRESIDYSVGLPVSTRTLELKLSASEEAERRVRDQYLYLQEKLKEKDDLIDRVRAESTMNAQAVKKFVEENQKLALECANLLNQCKKWEKECSMYDCDREALMDFGNEADHRREEAESQVRELEEELSKLSKELQCYKNQAEGQQSATTRKMSVTVFSCDGSVVPITCTVTVLKQGRVKDFIQAVSNACALKQNEKVFIVEVKVLDKENSMLEKENRRLTKLLHKERHLNDSGGKHNSASLKSNKWKSGPRDCSPIKKKIDFIESGSPRNTLSPLRQNTPESRMHKK